MKLNVLYIIIFLSLVSCKNNKKSSSNIQMSNQYDSVIAEKEVKNTFSKQDSTKILKERLLGTIYSDLKEIDEFKKFSSGGASIGNDFNNKKYTFSSIRGSNDIVKYVLFEENLGSKFKILDLLDLTKEKLLKDEDKNLYYHFCYMDNKNDQEIIAIAEYEEKEFLTKILKAWRADRKTEKIIEIPVDGIKVENIDHGL